MTEVSDAELLRNYVEEHSERAFAELVRRHVGLVYSVARRRQLDSHRAEDVAQAVFCALAVQAPKLTGHAVLSGWLHRTARNIAAQTVRTESRRRAREREAAAMNSPDPAANSEHGALLHLDNALNELRDTDRDALLLRYFERRSADDMARTLGIGSEAAQKRVSRALDRLRAMLLHRGVGLEAGSLAVLLATQTAEAAPPALAAKITAAVAGLTAFTPTTSALIAMTTLQKSALAASLVLLAGTTVYQTHRVSILTDRVASLTREAAAVKEPAPPRVAAPAANAAEIAALRQEIAELKLAAARSLPGADESQFNRDVRDFTGNAAKLNDHLNQNPEWRIPELDYLSESDWIEAGKLAKFDTPEEVRRSLMMLRGKAKHNTYGLWQEALRQYLEAHGGQLPGDTLELRPYFPEEVPEALLSRYRMARTGAAAEAQPGQWLIEERQPVDVEYDLLMRMAVGGLDISPIPASTPH